MNSPWLSLTQDHLYRVMYWLRHALQRQCFQPYIRKRRNQRRLFKWAKAAAQHDIDHPNWRDE